MWVVGNYLAFFERNSNPDSPFASLYAPLHVQPFTGACDILVLLDAAVASRYDEFVAAVGEGVRPPPIVPSFERKSYLDKGAQVYYAKGAQPPRVEVARPAGATAMPVRDSFMQMLIHAAWREPSDDADFLRWARAMYRDVYADTGGVPAPDETNAGSYINYPDPDLRDPHWNTSRASWHNLYYRDNYPRLQQIKAKWDPRNIFRHELAIEPPSS